MYCMKLALLILVSTVLSMTIQNNISAEENSEPANANYQVLGANEIDTVYFILNKSPSLLESQEIILTFWLRDCETCLQDGHITLETQLQNIQGNYIPVTKLRKNKRYEALSIVFSNTKKNLIEHIILAEITP